MVARLLAGAWSERRLFDRRVWLLTSGQILLAMGRGVLLPFATLYFYNERGFPLAVLGLALAVALPLGALVGLLWGALSDRVGRKPLMLLGFVGMAVSSVALAFVVAPWQYFVVIVLQAVAMGAWNPAARAMVADITAPERRTRAFGLLYFANNAGISAGLLVGGLLALALPYRALFAAEAVGAAAYFLVVLLRVPESRPPTSPGADAAPARSTWSAAMDTLRDVSVPLRDARFLLFGFAGLLAGVGWAQYYLTYSPYLKNVIGASEAWIGAMFAINTGLAVILQVPVAAWAERRRRTRVYRYAIYLLGWAMLITWAAGRIADDTAALLLMGAGVAIMTLGEVLIVPVGSALVAGLAGGPAHFGKYLAGYDLVWTLAIGVGGIVGGLFFDAGAPFLLWPVATLSVVLSLGAYAWLGRVLPSEVEAPAAPSGSASEPSPAAPPTTSGRPPSGAEEPPLAGPAE